MHEKLKQMNGKESQSSETVCFRDIETKVFQGIVLQVLSTVEGIGLLENTLFDSLLGRDVDRLKGIHVEQEPKNQSVNVRIELNIAYGVPIPEKAKEIQELIIDEIKKFTGLHVSSVHVIFKHLMLPQELKQQKIIEEQKEEEEVY